MELDVLVEALLFYKAAPQNKKKVAKLFAVTDEDLQKAINNLRDRLQTGATRLNETDTEIQLVTAPELSEFVESLRKQEISNDIGKAGAEDRKSVV